MSSLEKWISANIKLNECMASVGHDSYSAMSKADQEQVCHNELAAVRNMIVSDQVHIKSILQDRLAILESRKWWDKIQLSLSDKNGELIS